MNIPRLLIAIAVGFIFAFAADFVIHTVWLAPGYQATSSLWRTEDEMQARFPAMVAGQLLIVIAFAVIWAKGFAMRGGVTFGALFGLWMGLFQQATTLISYSVSPLPGSLAANWFIAGVLRMVVLGVIIALIYSRHAQEEARVDV